MALPFVGPSYNLRSRTADVQRTTGMYPVPIEPGNTRTAWAFKDFPGKVEWSSIGGEGRAGKNVNGRLFVVFGTGLYEVASDGTETLRGTLASAFGFVGMAFNSTQLVVGDDANLYVLTLSSNAFQTIAYPGSGRVEYLNQYILFKHRESQQFGWTALGDATLLDPLDFASAEGSPDNIVGLIVDHREVLILGSDSGEPWLNTGTTSVFERNSGAALEVGCASEWTICKMDGSVYWLAASSRGQGSVVRLQGYQPIIVSTQAIEERLRDVDLSDASAYTIEWEKNNFYCLNVPALDTTLVYNAFSGQWSEWAELVDGASQKDRGTFHVYAFGRHLTGAADGKLYELDASAYTNAGTPLVRERITPNEAVPGRARVPRRTFTLDCDRGTGGTVQMRYSNNGGRTWSRWHTRSLGAIGVYGSGVQWRGCGSGKDRVTQVRCTDAVPFNPVAGGYL